LPINDVVDVMPTPYRSNNSNNISRVPDNKNNISGGPAATRIPGTTVMTQSAIKLLVEPKL
jgi:hypothetical protein